MKEIADKILTLYEIKADIKDAIISKGVEAGDDFKEYADDIRNIKSNDILDFIEDEKYKECFEDWFEQSENEYNKVVNLPSFNDYGYYLGESYPIIKGTYLGEEPEDYAQFAAVSAIKVIDIDCGGRTAELYGFCTGDTEWGNNTIEYVTIRNAVITDLQEAFRDCNRLKEVTFINCHIDADWTAAFATYTGKYIGELYPLKINFINCDKVRVLNATSIFSTYTYNTHLIEDSSFLSDMLFYVLNLLGITSTRFKYLPKLNYTSCNPSIYLTNVIKAEELDLSKINQQTVTFTMPFLRYGLFKGIGDYLRASRYEFTNAPLYGIPDTVENDELNGIDTLNARLSLVDSLITYSYDRYAAGYSVTYLLLSNEMKNVLTSNEIAQITSKGYSII